MVDMFELEKAIKKAKLNKGKVAKMLGITSAGLYKKLANKSEFKASEIYKLKAILSSRYPNNEVFDFEKIFFANESDFKSLEPKIG